MKQIIVHKGRTVIVPVGLGFDVSNDEFSSEIRVAKDRDSELIAAWDVSFETDGVDGELILKLDDSVTAEIVYGKGYMDLKRISAGEPYSVFDEPLEVLFQSTITA